MAGSHQDTYWKCTTVDPDNPPWELRYQHGKGYAAFSLKKFSKGDHILTERPIISVRGHHPFSPEQIIEIERKLSELTTDEQQAFDAMSNVFPEVASSGAGIFMTNSFDMTDSPDGPSCGMYLAVAR